VQAEDAAKPQGKPKGVGAPTRTRISRKKPDAGSFDCTAQGDSRSADSPKAEKSKAIGSMTSKPNAVFDGPEAGSKAARLNAVAPEARRSKASGPKARGGSRSKAARSEATESNAVDPEGHPPDGPTTKKPRTSGVVAGAARSAAAAGAPLVRSQLTRGISTQKWKARSSLLHLTLPFTIREAWVHQIGRPTPCLLT
jgi:hypothetical protein